MTVNEFQIACQRTAPVADGSTLELATALLGLTSEAGECADVLKKHIERGQPLNYENMRLELGDAFYYLARVATLIGSDLSEIAALNVKKLRERYPVVKP